MIRLILAFCLALVALTACSSTQTPADSGAQAADLAKSVRAGAVLAVKTLDTVNEAYIDSVKAPSPSELEVMRAVTGALVKARDVLNASATVEQQILEVAKQLKLATDMLAAVGVTPPPEAKPVLEFIEAYARARGDS